MTKRNPEYQKFLDIYHGHKPDPYPPDQEIPATAQEVSWFKQAQIKRAIGHARQGKATKAELTLLAKHKIYYPSTPFESLPNRLKEIRLKRPHTKKPEQN